MNKEKLIIILIFAIPMFVVFAYFLGKGRVICPACERCEVCDYDVSPYEFDVTFDMSENMRIYNDMAYKVRIDKAESIRDRDKKIFQLKIDAGEQGLNDSLVCVEHRFRDFRMPELVQEAVPTEVLLSEKHYRIQCWDLIDLEPWQQLESDMHFEGNNVNQIVRIFLVKIGRY